MLIRLLLYIFLTGALYTPMALANTNLTLEQGKIDPNRPYLRIRLVYNYDVYTKPIFFKPKSQPSYVIWVQEPESGFIESIFVTQKAGKNKWTFTSSRPEVIPVWYGVNKREKERSDFDIDAISGATAKGEGATILWQVPEELIDKEVDIFIEANNSFDFNEFYGKDKNDPGYSGANGQPSLVWKASLDLSGNQRSSLTPEIIGHGDRLGRTHFVSPDTTKITTAAQTFRKITIHFNP